MKEKIFKLDFHQNISWIKFRGILISDHMIQYKGVYFMWFKVHTEQHTLLTQSLQQGILCVFTSFSCDSSSLMWPAFFLWTMQSACRNKVADYVRPARPLFCTGCYCFQHQLKVITSCMTKEWSGHARLQSVLHGFLLYWVHYFSDFSIGCNNGKMMTMTKTTFLLGSEACILLQSTCTTTYQVITHVKQSNLLCKQAACSDKNFQKTIFVLEIKSTNQRNLLSSKISYYMVYEGHSMSSWMYLAKLQ